MTTPVASYNFDETEGDVLDYSGNNHDWTPGSNVTRVPGHTNNGLSKNNVGLPVICEPLWPGVDLTSSWTIMFWQQNLGNGTWWARLYNSSVDSGSGILNLGGTLRARVRRSSGNTEAAISTPADGLTQHYCATYDGLNVRLYVDGNLQATSANAPAPALAVDRIDIAEASVANFYMDDFRIYDVALDQPTIASLKNTPVSAEPFTSSRWWRGDGVELHPFLLTSGGLVGLE